MLTKTEKQAVIKAFLARLMTQPYGQIAMRQVAQDAKVPLSKVLMTYSTRYAILDAFAEQIDKQVLDGDDPEMVDEPPRERLFDVLMRRYDALAPFKIALIQLENDARRDPALAMNLTRTVRRSLQRLATSADVEVDGPRGAIVLAGLMRIHGRVLRTWLGESDAGQALTMAELDKALRQAERHIEDLDRTVLLLRGEGGAKGGPLCRLRARFTPRTTDAETVNHEPAASPAA